MTVIWFSRGYKNRWRRFWEAIPPRVTSRSKERNVVYETLRSKMKAMLSRRRAFSCANSYAKFFSVSVVAGVFSLLGALSACGDGGQIDAQSQWLASYYHDNPPNGNWVAREVRSEGAKKIAVYVSIPSQKQISQVKRLSRMEQFTVAKLACPKEVAEIQKMYREGITVWIHLMDKNETLTVSVCPHN